MKITLIPEAGIPPSVWSGGSSRQLFIYPPEASYGAGDFLVRLSTAETFSGDEAKYTILPGITRHLVMLEGEARIVHGGSSALVMKPLETIDVFDGGLETVCAGKVRDFNLMLGPGAAGTLSVRDGGADPRVVLSDRGTRSWLGLYCARGEALAEYNTGRSRVLKPGSLLLVEDFASGGEITLTTGKGARIVQAAAWLTV